VKQFFKNKFFYIISVVTLLVTLVPMIFYSMGLTFVLRDAVGILLTPMQKLFNYATEAVDGFTSYFYKFDQLVEENNALKEEVASLRQQVYDSTKREEMYAWLSDFLELKISHNDYEFLAASVTGRESGNYSRVLTLDVGTGAGVALNMPVITSEGIVGQITEVGYNWSKVTTIVEASSSVGAYVERTQDAGVCEGNFVLSADGICLLNYLSADSTVTVGDRVLSTGYGSVYPRDLVVGYVTDVTTNPYTRGLEVQVQCAVDFSQLTQVMIITDFETVAVDAARQ